MKNLFLIILALLASLQNNITAQSAEEYYKLGKEASRAEKYDEAIDYFSRSITLEPMEPVTWYLRGRAKYMLNNPEEALPDFEQAISINPDLMDAYLLRGLVKRELTDYEGALNDFTYLINSDSTFSYAYYHRARIYEMFLKEDSACADFKKSFELGFKQAERKVENCNKPSDLYTIYPILRLAKVSDDKDYGFTSEKPIKVGRGPDGGPANNRAYLDLLRDANGKPVKYHRKGSCCPYPSENGLFGSAMVDHYEITYTDEVGNVQKASVYISFYDYEEPKILYGFKTVRLK